MGFIRQVTHSSTITPPIPQGERLRLTPMQSQQTIGDVSDVIDQIKIVSKGGRYNGIYTGGMSFCAAVTIVERDSKAEMTDILMLHFPGGLNRDGFDALMNYLRKRKLENEGYREFIIAAGNVVTDMQSFKDNLEKHLKVSGDQPAMSLDTILSQPEYEKLAFRGPCKYILAPKEIGSSCTTFDGYSGPFYANENFTGRGLPDEGDITVSEPELEQERAEFAKIKKAFKDFPEIEAVEATLESAPCADKIKAKLYFYTREFIFNTQCREFNPATKLTEIYRATNKYKEEIVKLLPGLFDRWTSKSQRTKLEKTHIQLLEFSGSLISSKKISVTPQKPAEKKTDAPEIKKASLAQEVKSFPSRK